MYTYMYVCMYMYTRPLKLIRHRLNGYLAQRVPSLSLAGSFRMCLNCEVLEGMFSWRTRYP